MVAPYGNEEDMYTEQLEGQTMALRGGSIESYGSISVASTETEEEETESRRATQLAADVAHYGRDLLARLWQQPAFDEMPHLPTERAQPHPVRLRAEEEARAAQRILNERRAAIEAAFGTRFQRNVRWICPPIVYTLSTPMSMIARTSARVRALTTARVQPRSARPHASLRHHRELRTASATPPMLRLEEAAGPEGGQLAPREGRPSVPPHEPPGLFAGVSHRSPAIFEQLLYNMRSFGQLPADERAMYLERIDCFERRWTPIRPIFYYIQDHRARCPRMTTWPREKDLRSTLDLRYGTKCRCPFEGVVSYVSVPFYFHAVRLNRRPTVPLSLGAFAREEAVFDAWTPAAPHAKIVLPIERGGPRITGSVRQPAIFTQPVVIAGKRRTAEVLAGRRSVRRHHTAILGEKPKRRSRLRKEAGRPSTTPPHSLHPDTQYVRGVPDGVWIRSRTSFEARSSVLHVVVFFGGKDMLAVAWLPLASQWLQHEVREAAFAAAGGRVPGARAAPAPESPSPSAQQQQRRLSRSPQFVPKWEEETLSRARRPSVRNRQINLTAAASTATVLAQQTSLSGASMNHRLAPTTAAAAATTGAHEGEFEHRTPSLNDATEPPPRRIFPSDEMVKVSCYMNVAFVFVEYPGYGCSDGVATASSCADSGVEAVRNLIREVDPLCVEVHCIGYSLGAAVCLRFINIMADQLVMNHRCRSMALYHYNRLAATLGTVVPGPQATPPTGYLSYAEPLSRIVGVRDLVLIAPFLSTWDCANSLLGIPKGLQRMSKLVFDVVSSRKIQYDNRETLGRLMRLLRAHRAAFSTGFRLSIMFGDEDQLIAAYMGPTLASYARDAYGRADLNASNVKINCIRVVGSDHATVLDPNRVLRVLLKHHRIHGLCIPLES